MSFLRRAAAFFVLLPVGLHRHIQLYKIFADTFRAAFVHSPALTGTGLQMRAVGVEHPPVSHSASQCLLHDMVENLLKDITVIKAADAVLAEGGIFYLRVRLCCGLTASTSPFNLESITRHMLKRACTPTGCAQASSGWHDVTSIRMSLFG